MQRRREEGRRTASAGQKSVAFMPTAYSSRRDGLVTQPNVYYAVRTYTTDEHALSFRRCMHDVRIIIISTVSRISEYILCMLCL